MKKSVLFVTAAIFAGILIVTNLTGCSSCNCDKHHHEYGREPGPDPRMNRRIGRQTDKLEHRKDVRNDRHENRFDKNNPGNPVPPPHVEPK